ncbi:hypothetical protein ACPV5O_20950 [Vibrio maritimus]|uniref:hypothetical protein n=1 Tax=Vibrio maritimus TaxID=990268 RepID=UPI004067FB05
MMSSKTYIVDIEKGQTFRNIHGEDIDIHSHILETCGRGKADGIKIRDNELSGNRRQVVITAEDDGAVLFLKTKLAEIPLMETYPR